ncbi:hypothetical protein DIJ61_00020 [Burkholderia pseudomallei]|uniref:Uncharacterized protein n=1 Tax=Burkholderia pseudomallei TaxID=28450 RepID=A0AAX0UE06_BURPE|nr:hypothetical protein CWD88_10190 [Burkholderia pseudomallei]TOZ26235.1 hypothetical protein DIJ60_36805 [Burkholderia pseudomallei]TPA33479.1 hypothetical protein DIJ61_00020 [Burkholderia pseudomallei]
MRITVGQRTLVIAAEWCPPRISRFQTPTFASVPTAGL